MLSINTNLPSLIAQNSLKKSTLKLNQAVERMSRGYKINHAKDNAANYSISTNMTTKIGAYQVAEDNVSMGLALLATADDSLSLISDKLARLRALSEQAANGTYGEQSLKAINSEANAIVDEIERAYSTTEYNGIKLFGEKQPQFIEDVQKRDTSSMTTLASVDENTVISSGTYSISSAEELAKLASMTNNSKVTGGEFVLANDIDLSAYSTGEGWTPIGTIDIAFSGKFDGNGYIISNLTINRNDGPQGLFSIIDTNASITNLGIKNANINANGSNSPYIGGLSGTNVGTISNCYVLGNINGYYIVGGLVGANAGTINNCYTGGTVSCNDMVAGGIIGAMLIGTISNCYTTSNVSGVSTIGGFAGIINDGSITNCYSCGKEDVDNFIGGKDPDQPGGTIDSKSGAVTSVADIPLINAGNIIENIINIQCGTNASEASQITITTSVNLANLDILRNIGNKDSDCMSFIDNLSNVISNKQTELGAAQNRLESALEEIATHYENLSSSSSTIKDADIAKVSSEYIRQQILQQASATLLSTANQTPALALQLL